MRDVRDRYIIDLFARITAIPRFKSAEGYSSSSPGDPVSIPHDLGVIPDMVVPEPLADMTVYSTPDDRNAWTSTQVVVRGSAASQPFNLLLVKF